MNFIDGNMKAVCAKSDDTIEKKIFDFSLEEEDYFLNYHTTWDHIEGDFYDLELDGRIFSIPSGIYILCTCDEGNTDWIMVDELIGRDIDILVLTKSLRSWIPSKPKVRNFYRSANFYPMSRTPVPIINSTEERIIIVSSIDQHSKMKDKYFNIFLV